MLKSLGKSVIIYGVGSSLSKFVGIFLIPIFSRYYSPQQYGSIDLISTVISFVAIIGMLQLESSISRFYYEADDDNRKDYIATGFWVIFLISSTLTLLLVVFSPVASWALFKSDEYTPVLQFASINVLLLNLFGYLTVLLRFQHKPLLYSFVILSQFLITAITSVTLIYLDQGVMAFFIGQIFGLIAGLTFLVIYFREFLNFNIKTDVLKKYLKYSLPQVPAVAGNWVNSYVNRFIMLEYLTIADIGIYTVALKIASVFNLVDNAFRMAWEPFIWSKLENSDFKDLIRKISVWVTIIIFSISLLCNFFSKELLMILSTKEYFDALPLIKILFVALTFPVLTQVFGIGTSIAKKTIYNTVGFLAGILLNIALMLLLVRFAGLTSIPLSLLASNISIFILMWFFSERLSPLGFGVASFLLNCTLFLLVSYIIFVYELGLIYKLAIAAAIAVVAAIGLTQTRLKDFL